MTENTDTTSDTTNGRVRRSRQQQIAGTEHKCSAELRRMVQERAEHVYAAKHHQAEVQRLNELIVPRMQAEKVEEISSEVAVDDEMRRCITRATSSTKLTTELEKQVQE